MLPSSLKFLHHVQIQTGWASLGKKLLRGIPSIHILGLVSRDLGIKYDTSLHFLSCFSIFWIRLKWCDLGHKKHYELPRRLCSLEVGSNPGLNSSSDELIGNTRQIASNLLWFRGPFSRYECSVLARKILLVAQTGFWISEVKLFWGTSTHSTKKDVRVCVRDVCLCVSERER